MTEPTIFVQGGERYWVAHVPVLPGCVASGPSRDEAIANARRAFPAYLELLGARGVSIDHWKDLDPDAFGVADYPAAGLAEDLRDLEEHQVRDFLHQYEASHAALIGLVQGLSPDQLDQRPTETSWSVRQTLEHIMTSDVLLLSRTERWPEDPFNTLQAVHRLVFQRLAVMDPAEQRRTRVVNGRTWTTRTVMRRLLEHEYEHYGQIKEIMAGLGGDRPPE
ncbi:MAG TPA: type II toxin-antitoxin system HicB family antitoxin [Candidatus Saccharimonadales bacterium]|nr:type II toxin-antitoxin system HicB family antitoxin [Candidatus Saccharimonadales bacterium]